MFYSKNSKIFVAGHQGLVGSAIVRQLKKNGYENLIYKTHQELNLENYKETSDFILNEKPTVIFLAAAKVGGIFANNTYPVDFLVKNLSIQLNVINAAFLANTERLFFLGSSCIYPKSSPQPIKEEFLLTSELEPTNRPYALAKITGIEQCWAYNRQYNTKYLAVMPTNLYGLNDNYDLESSHVLPALIRKIYEAKYNNLKEVEIWGTGLPKREFLNSDDLAEALIFLMNLDPINYDLLVNKERCPIINIGSEKEITISDLAHQIKEIIGYSGSLFFNSSKPDGTMRKLMSSKKIFNLGWKPKIPLQQGIKIVYEDFKKNLK